LIISLVLSNFKKNKIAKPIFLEKIKECHKK